MIPLLCAIFYEDAVKMKFEFGCIFECKIVKKRNSQPKVTNEHFRRLKISRS